jgi:proline iminopeptidase
MPPIPPPRDSGHFKTAPLYRASYGPAGAPRLLVLHGGPGAQHDYLLPQMLALAERRECVFYDQRGAGRSADAARAGEPITWRTHVDDLRSVLAELGDPPAAIVGYSWGALLAMLHAMDAVERGERIPHRLVLLDPAPVTRPFRRVFEAEFARRQESAEIRAIRDELATSGLRERDPDAYRRRMFAASIAGYFADPHRAVELTPFRVVGRIQQSVWESLGDFDLLARGQLDRVRTPALVVHGREDPIPLASSEGAARALGAALVVLERCGHVPYVEQPEALFGAVERFLESA